MTIYRRQKRHSFKWIVAAVLFVMIMTVTFDDVYGLGMPAGVGYHGGSGSYTVNMSNQPQMPSLAIMASSITCSSSAGDETPNDPITGTPEPSTIILLLSGLGALRLLRRP